MEKKLNKLGYTKVELLIVVILLGVVAFVTINKTSYAFAIDTTTAVAEVKNLIEIQAEEYALDNLDIFKESETTFIDVNTLVDRGYLMGDDEGLITDPSDVNKNFNQNKIELKYNSDKETVEANLVD